MCQDGRVTLLRASRNILSSDWVKKTLTYYWALVPTSPVFQLAQQQPDAFKYDSRGL